MSKPPPERKFAVVEKAVRERTPLYIGLFSPSGGGKTFSALRLAVGIQKIVGGKIGVVDTENRRALAYADRFEFMHLDFKPPFASLDYLAAMRQLKAAGCNVIIVDSMSHEHDGVGGMLEAQEAELDRLAGPDANEGRRKAMNMLAWQKPKAARRALLNGMLQIDANFVLCFRAKETAKPMKVNGKTEVVPLGFMPIAGDEFVFEMTLAALLMPGARGVPTWQSEQPGERLMIKVPIQFESLRDADNPKPLDEVLGQRLAEWAQGVAPSKEKAQEPQVSPPPPSPPPPPPPPPGPASGQAEGGFPGDREPTRAASKEEREAADLAALEARQRERGFGGDQPAQGGLDLQTDEALNGPRADESEAQDEADDPPATGFVAFADDLADALSWVAIVAALKRLFESEEWKASEEAMRGRARALAYRRLRELNASGDEKLDFIADAQAFRSYIEAEEDVDALEGNWRAFDGGPVFSSLAPPAKEAIARAVAKRRADLAAGGGDFQ